MTRPGYALLYALFFTMALAVVGLGAMATGTRETMIARTLELHTLARARAEAGALDVAAAWSTRSFVALEPGATIALDPTPDLRRTVTRLDTGLFLVRSETRRSTGDADDAATDHAATAAASLLVRALEPDVLLGAFPAVVTAEHDVRLEPGARVTASAGCGVDPVGVLAPAVSAGAGTEIVAPSGRDLVLETPRDRPRPDPFHPDVASVLATRRPRPGTVVPGPMASGGVCVPGPRNWGAVDAGSPCHELLPLVHRAGSLRIAGGEGRGVLVVDGDLEVDGHAGLHGAIIVHGTLRLAPGVDITGFVRARSVLINGATVTGSPCTARTVLSAPTLDRAFRPPARWWIPAF